MEINELFIRNLKKLRKIKGFTQEKLAEKCGAAYPYIRQLECGNRSPSFSFIGKIASALEIEPYQLFYDESAKVQPMQEKRIKSIRAKLIETLSSDVENAFEELKK